MDTIELRTIDPATLDRDDDVWVEACVLCGSPDNFGELVCRACDG